MTQNLHPVQATPGQPPVVAGDTEQQQYLTFLLGEEMFAIGILAIREIIEYGQITEVPLVPPFIRGVINLRGAVVPVIDLSVRFGRSAGEITKRTCIVIIEIAETAGAHAQQMGVVVDARYPRCWKSRRAISNRRPPSGRASAPTSFPAWARSAAVSSSCSTSSVSCRSTRWR